MEERIRRPDRYRLTNRQSPAIFAGLQNLESWNIRIYMWPETSVCGPTWWTVESEETPYLCIMTSYILTYFTSWIEALRESEDRMNTLWRIAANFGIERHETYDPDVSAKLTDGRGTLL